MTGLAGLARCGGDGRDDEARVRAMLARLSPISTAVVTRVGDAVCGNLHGAPARSADHMCVVSWDGRLDNDAEVRAWVGRPVSPYADDEPQLIADVCARGAQALPRILGDFALAAWYPQSKRLMLARDALSQRPLFYAYTPDVCWWASSVAALVSGGAPVSGVNDGYFAEYLASAPVSLNETPLLGAWRLPQASYLEWSGGQPRIARYWNPEPIDEARLSEGDATAQLRHLLERAVTDRLRVSRGRTACAQLSGGLDSSAIVGLAARQQHEVLDTYSIVFPTIPRADESPYVDAVTSHHGCRSVRLPYAASSPATPGVFAEAVSHLALPEMTTGSYLMSPMLRAAERDGHEVMLTGLGGDDWLTGSLFHLSDLVRRGQLRAAWRFAGEFRSVPWLDPGARVMWRSAVAALLPEWIKQPLRPRRVDTPWLTDAFITQTRLVDRQRAVWDAVPSGRSVVVRESLARLWSGDLAHGRDAMHRIAQAAGLEQRQPFLDRRVVEFLLTLPDAFRLQAGRQRWLLRQACADVLPPLVAARVDKPVFDQVQLDGIRSVDPDAMLREPLEVEARGWVRRGETALLWQRIRSSLDTRTTSEDFGQFVLWQILGAEAFVRALSSRSV